MSAEETKAIVRRFVNEILNAHDVAAADAIVADDCVMAMTGLPEPLHGREAMTTMARAYFAAFPDMHMTFEDLLAEGDRAAARFTVHATHRGELMGLPATGKAATWSGIAMWQVAHGRVVNHWVEQDMLGLLQQLGAIPNPAQAPA